MSQKIESFIRCLNNPVFYHCVGCDQVGNYCSAVYIIQFSIIVQALIKVGNYKECHEMSQKIESFICWLNYPVFIIVQAVIKVGNYCSAIEIIQFYIFVQAVIRVVNYKECHEMSQKIESFIRCLNNPVFCHCVGCDQGGELQGVP